MGNIFSLCLNISRFPPYFLLRFVGLQILHDIAHGLQPSYVGIIDLNAAGLLQSHDQLYGRQGIRAQVVGQGMLSSG